MYLVLYIDPYTVDGKVHIRSKFFAVQQQACMYLLQEPFIIYIYIYVNDWKDKLIGFGCDGTSVNILPL